MRTVLDTVDEMRNDWIVQLKKKSEKDKKIEIVQLPLNIIRKIG
jgi:hypothetical protein